MQSITVVDWLELDVDFYDIQLLLGSATHVTTLLLMACPDVTDEGLAVLSGCTSLKQIDLTHCSAITDEALIQIAEACTKLEMSDSRSGKKCRVLTNFVRASTV